MGTPEIVLRCTDTQGVKGGCRYYEARTVQSPSLTVHTTVCRWLNLVTHECTHARARQEAIRDVVGEALWGPDLWARVRGATTGDEMRVVVESGQLGWMLGDLVVTDAAVPEEEKP